MSIQIKIPVLVPLDLSKCCHKKGDGLCEDAGTCHHHPDIKSSKTYLAKIDGEFFSGHFSSTWYGWSFDGWGGGGGLQLDKPGTNGSTWQGLWEIQTKG